MKLTLTQHQLNEIEVKLFKIDQTLKFDKYPKKVLLQEQQRLKGILKLKYVEL